MTEETPIYAFGRITVDLHREDFEASLVRAKSLGMTRKAYVTKLIRDDLATLRGAFVKKGAKTK